MFLVVIRKNEMLCILTTDNALNNSMVSFPTRSGIPRGELLVSSFLRRTGPARLRQLNYAFVGKLCNRLLRIPQYLGKHLLIILSEVWSGEIYLPGCLRELE